LVFLQHQKQARIRRLSKSCSHSLLHQSLSKCSIRSICGLQPPSSGVCLYVSSCRQKLTSWLVSVSTHAASVQFFKQSEQYGAALATRSGANGTDILLRLEAPTTYQWAALGTGDKMDKSFMILMQPSSANSGKQFRKSLPSSTKVL
jgi:hypothetical protein